MKKPLDAYKDAYHEQFKFNDENILMLTWYSERIAKTMAANNVKSIISLGIGHKVVSKKIINDLGKSLKKYFIIEGSKEIIKEFEKNTRLSSNIVLINSLFEEFETKEKFDAIEMGFVLEHVDDPLLLIKQYAKFLNSSGTIFIAVPNARSLHRLIGHQAGILDNLYRLSNHDRELGHKRYFDLESLVKLVQDSGLQIAGIGGLFLKPFSTEQLKSLALSKEVINALFHIGVKYPEISNAIYIEATS